MTCSLSEIFKYLHVTGDTPIPLSKLGFPMNKLSKITTKYNELTVTKTLNIVWKQCFACSSLNLAKKTFEIPKIKILKCVGP